MFLVGASCSANKSGSVFRKSEERRRCTCTVASVQIDSLGGFNCWKVSCSSGALNWINRRLRWGLFEDEEVKRPESGNRDYAILCAHLDEMPPVVSEL